MQRDCAKEETSNEQCTRQTENDNDIRVITVSSGFRAKLITNCMVAVEKMPQFIKY